jgi:glutathione S-transferase
MIILHHGWRSSASRRVRLCLAEKGLAYQGHAVGMAAMEHHSPEYLRINPLGVIPTLVHDGRPLHESGTICEYLDEMFPAPPLRPDTPYERAEMRDGLSARPTRSRTSPQPPSQNASTRKSRRIR